MKIFNNLLIALMLCTTFSLRAEISEIDFSYSETVETYLGVQKSETYDVAIFLPGEAFGGYVIKSLSVPVNNTSGISKYSKPSIWLSSKLQVKNKLNDPDITSCEAEISSNGILSGELPEAYTIPADGVYVGYSVTVTGLNTGTQFPVAVGESSDTNSLYLRTSSTATQWSNIAEEMGYGSSMVVKLECELPERAVSIASMTNPIYLQLGETKSVPVTLAYTGSETLNSIDINYSISGKGYSSHIDLENAVPAGINKKFMVGLEIPAMDNIFNEKVEFEVVKVNGKDNKSKNPLFEADVKVLKIVPTHQTLIEESTCTKCGYCVRGYAALEYIKQNYPDFVVVSYHNNAQGKDPMTVATFPVSSNGNPSVSLNRMISGDPYYGTQRYNTEVPIIDDILALNSEVTPWIINVSHEWVDDNHLTAKAEVSNVIGYDNEKYKIAYILVADGLTGTASGWTQSNYYYTENPQFVEELNNFCRGGKYGKASVKGLVFDDVIISKEAYTGVSGSLPESLEAETEVNHSFTFDLSINPTASLVQDRNKLRVIAAVVDKNGFVLNCAKNEVNDWVPNAVDSIVSDGIDAPVEYYNLNGVKVANPSNGIFIRKQGDKTSKVILK